MFPTPSEPWFGSFVKDQIEAVRRLGVEVDLLRFDGRRDWRAYPRAGRELRRRVAHGGYDLVHAHYGLAGAVALCQRAAPVVTTFHGSDSAQIAWQRRVSWIVARRSTPIFVSAANARRLGLPGAAVVPAGVDTDLFEPRDRADARAELGWDRDRTYVLLPGARSNPLKGVALFDGAVRELGLDLPDVRGVSLEGYERHEVATVMNAVDLVLLTSDHEGSPVVVKEALACTTPVVSVDVGDVPSLLAGLPGCAIAPRDPAALARAALAARQTRDPALRRRALTFSYDVIAREILEIYDRATPPSASVRSARGRSAHGAA
jgi:glycosyltransferase involved in cell wall biosynthesis